ncbi:MAG: rRNA maturation RNase YbeY [Pseudomonadota bacterium]|nr:rRNA maturation RNase YbeY [Pseudomonadota bacterium]
MIERARRSVAPRLALSLQGHAGFPGLPARSTLVRWIAAALQRDAQITLRFVGLREGARLNREYRGKDYATDVLTFGYAPEPTVRADIVICVPVVKLEARARGKPLYDHLAHLAVHATLHAHGLHHDTAAAARVLEKHERTILKSLGKRDPY